MNPQQKAAYDAVRAARHKGLLERPLHCERCGKPDQPCSDGRTWLHGHHEDYSKPLDVQWLCAKCHRKVTRLRIGEQHPRAILTSKLVQAAILLRQSGFTATEIAEFYGVSRAAISHAVNGKNWLKEREK